MLLDEASVTGTANIVMAAVLRRNDYNLQCSMRTVFTTVV